MRRFVHILLFLLPLLACTREIVPLVPEEPEDNAPEGTVSVTFSFAVAAEEPRTKAYSDDPLDERSRLETMHLAIFGSSGYYKDYIEAHLLTDKTYPIREKRTFYRDELDAEGKPKSFEKEVDVYAFTAELKLANTERVIHFIGNGPSTIRVGKDAEVLPSELSGEGKTGFWQMVRLPQGIKAQTAKDDQGNEFYINQHYGKDDGYSGVYGNDPNDRYVISDETLKYFQYHLEGYEDEEKTIPVFSTEKGIPLIRNWSKVSLKNSPESNFTPVSFAVVHFPKQGTLVPYGGKTGFIPDYQSKSFTVLSDLDGLYAYKGNLPEKANLFDETIPGAEYFGGTAGNVNVKQYDPRYDENSSKYDASLPEDNEPAVYLYERPVPTDNMQPTFVIVYGTYYRADDPIFMSQNKGADWPDAYDSTSPHIGEKTKDNSLTFEEYYKGVKCYYKVDFMSGGEYYPILRNFKYQIKIDKITARGHSTPVDAAFSAGSADVSANINAAHLADISDGTRRMAIQPWMSHTFIHSDTEVTDHGLAVKFIDDINPSGDNDGINYDDASVTWSLSPDNGVISGISIGSAANGQANPDDNGWRKIKFKVNDVAGTQTLRISCKTNPNDKNEQPLYRDIVITRMNKQEMRIQLDRESVPRMAGESQVVVINIPDGLPKSMFPVEFIIEPEKATLTPSTASNSENLPVKSGKSIVPGQSEKSAIQFKRTVTWDEYHGTPSDFVFKDETRWRSFRCHFITNCPDNATTVWVADKEGYFLAGNDNPYSKEAFSNHSSFHTPEFTTSIPAEAAPSSDPNVTVKTGVMAEDVGRENYFFMEVENLTPVQASGASFTLEEGNTYSFVASEETITFQFKTTAAGGNVSVKFKSADDSYKEAALTPWHFRNVGIVDGFERGTNSGSDVAFGHVSPVADKYFLVGFLTDSKNATPQISVKDLQGVKAVNSSFTGVVSSGTSHVNYREKWFQTTAGTEPISLTLSAVGYVEETVTAPRHNGAICSWDITGNSLNGLNAGNVIEKNNVTVINSIKANFSLKITSSDAEKQAQTHENGILLPKGGHYQLNAKIESNNSDVFLYYAQIHYLVSGDTPLKPYDANVEPHPDGSLYSAYLGNNYVYMWNIPWGETTGFIDMYAPAKQDIVITRVILRGYHGLLKDGIGLGDDLNDGGGL